MAPPSTGANVYGEDKIALEDRVQWTFDHEEEILWCAEDPLKFDWWQQAGKPFSFLAFCFEWQGYKRHGLNHVTRILHRPRRDVQRHPALLLRCSGTALVARRSTYCHRTALRTSTRT